MIDDWNPDDPDTVKVVYDLSSWNFDQQADVAADLAEAGIPHVWDGTDLMVPQEIEARADAVIDALEQRFGITYDDSNDGSDGDDLPSMPTASRIDLTDGEACTEYDLADWSALDRTTLTHTLTRQGRPFRWEGEVLLVHTADEELVEPLMDLIETGEFVDVDEADFDDDGADDTDADADELPFEVLTTFFLAADRLRRNPLDADGLDQLLAAVEVADPEHPPFGVEPRLWARTCELAEELTDALVEDDVPNEEAATEVAAELYELLRPFI